MANFNIFVAGHTGMVGSSILRLLLKKGQKNILTKSHSELDLTNQKDVINFFKKKKINQVYLAAAKVGGIYANSKFPADFIYRNLMILPNDNGLQYQYFKFSFNSFFPIDKKNILFESNKNYYDESFVCLKNYEDKSFLIENKSFISRSETKIQN